MVVPLDIVLLARRKKEQRIIQGNSFVKSL